MVEVIKVLTSLSTSTALLMIPVLCLWATIGLMAAMWLPTKITMMFVLINWGGDCAFVPS